MSKYLVRHKVVEVTTYEVEATSEGEAEEFIETLHPDAKIKDVDFSTWSEVVDIELIEE